MTSIEYNLIEAIRHCTHAYLPHNGNLNLVTSAGFRILNTDGGQMPGFSFQSPATSFKSDTRPS